MVGSDKFSSEVTFYVRSGFMSLTNGLLKQVQKLEFFVTTADDRKAWARSLFVRSP